jgi:hypothetical protein
LRSKLRLLLILTIVSIFMVSTSINAIPGTIAQTNHGSIYIDGNGGPASANSANPLTSGTSPDAPTGLTAVPGDGQISLNWIAPVFNGGQSIDYYIIYQDGEALPVHYVGLATVITELLNGWSYSFTVAAHNAAGTGPQCDPVTTTPYTTSTSGSHARFSPGNGEVTIYWAYPENDGGSPILYYVIYQDGVDIMHTTEFMVTITGLTNGHTYYFAVAAHNAAGDSPQRGATVTPIGAPDAPTGLSATPGNSQAFLTWTAPINNGGAVIDSYNVYQDGAGVTGTLKTSITITGLTNGHTYNFSISANSASGEGPQTSAVMVTPNAKVTVPGVPTGLTVTPGDGRMQLSWSPPGSNGGATIDYYVVFQNDIDVKRVTGNSTTITGLTNGQSYSFSVAAHNIASTGARSSTVQATPFTVPDAPTGFVAIPGNGQVTLSWIPPSFDGGRAIDYYIVYQDGVALPDHPTGTTTIITGLVEGQIYSFNVSAHNLAGIGLRSTASPSTPYTSPDAPTGLKAVVGNAQASLNLFSMAANPSTITSFTKMATP